MTQSAFQPDKGDHHGKDEVKLTPLMRAKDLSAHSSSWQAPDLQAEMARASREAFDRVLKAARAEVAEDLERMRQATLSQAKQEGFALGEQTGIKQGYEQGYAQGQKEAAAVLAVLESEFEAKVSAWEAERDAIKVELTESWQQLVVSLTASLTDVEDLLLQDIVWLTGQMAQRLVMAEIILHPENIQHLVHTVINQLPRVVYPLTLRLNAQDAELINRLDLSLDGRVDVQVDGQLARGEVGVRSGHSEVSLDWQTQTHRVIEAALQSLLSSKSQLNRSHLKVEGE